MPEASDPREPLPQVKIQLTTRHDDISLPEKAGPILVNTGEVLLPFLSPDTS